MKNLKQNLSRFYKDTLKARIDADNFPKGISFKVIRFLSAKKIEPSFFRAFRLSSFKIWSNKVFPVWSALLINNISFNDLFYYCSPKNFSKSSGSLHPEIKKSFKNLGIPLEKEKVFKNLAIDVIFDSVSISTSFYLKLAKAGVIFSSIFDTIITNKYLLAKFITKVVPLNDNFFSCLNCSIFTDGSFCYIPKKLNCPISLSTYFRINSSYSGQFERTLIVTEERSSLNYLEGCTATKYKKNQLHAAVVELISFENSRLKYSTIQNWYSGSNFGIGGIYNFVTKRGLCLGKKSKIFWVQIETGSSITWKYPSCLLLGQQAKGEFFSVAFTDKYQQSDTGTKIYHIAKNTKSKIISKSVSLGISKNIYRGLVKIFSNSFFSQNFSECDSFLLNTTSYVSTFPYLRSLNFSSIIEHEAKISQLKDEQLFYLQQRGLTREGALSLAINGFCEDVLFQLPLEFAAEADKLLSMKLHNSIG